MTTRRNFLRAKPRRRTDTPEARAFWAAVDRLAARDLPSDCRLLRLGDPWLDTGRELSASLVSWPDPT